MHNSFPDLPRNETALGTVVSNAAFTMSVAHFDVPDNGNSEIFINVQSNPHLDSAYGGYCVFAQIAAGDDASLRAVQLVKEAVLRGEKPGIVRATVA